MILHLVALMSLEVLSFSVFTCSETRILCFDKWGLVSFPWVLWAVTVYSRLDVYILLR